MSSAQKVLILINSPRGRISTSYTLGSFLDEKLSERSVPVELMVLSSSRDLADDPDLYHQSMDNADVLVFVFPLYSDHLPSDLVDILEDYSLHRNQSPTGKVQSALTIVNSGVPEAHHNDMAIAIIKRFAEIERMRWLGGLALGGGGFITPGVPLPAAGVRARRVMRALELTAQSIVQGVPIPRDSDEDRRRLLLPQWFYRALANWTFRRMAIKSGVDERMYSNPYAGPSNDKDKLAGFSIRMMIRNLLRKNEKTHDATARHRNYDN